MAGSLAPIGRAALRYPVVLATLTVGTVGGALELTGLGRAAQVLVSAYALAVAAHRARGMVAAMRTGSYGVDVLAVMAVVSTVLTGEYWASLVICLMLSGGEALETYAGGRARRELSALLERAPRSAHRARPDGGSVDVDVDDVAPGDELWVRPGEIFPVDATLLTSSATVDESSLTGESLPVEHHRGDALMSGAVNGGDAVRVRATATAADSQYQAIVALVKEAQASKAPFVRLADRVAAPFTLVALGLAAAAWALSGEATPCPLIIAAPVAFMAGMSRAARNGVLVKSAGTLEQLPRVRTVAFDKTGTLTHGAPVVAGVHPEPPFDADGVLRLAAAVEQYSAHPLAAAVVTGARERSLPVPAATDAEERTGHGVRATVEGRSVVVGKASYVAASTSGVHERAPVAGQTEVHVGVDGRYAGVVALSDEVRAESRATLAGLHAAGVASTLMLTGDAERTARHIAARIGIDDVRAGLLPQDKVAAVRALDDRPVMMVGDGVNDAPVLAVADVGVAMGARGSTAATESADVVIVLDDLPRLVRAVEIGHRTMRVAWQAIALGTGLSLALMVVAAFGMLPAVVGAWLQEAVDLACVLWALLASRPSTRSPRTRARLASDRTGSESGQRQDSGTVARRR